MTLHWELSRCSLLLSFCDWLETHLWFSKEHELGESSALLVLLVTRSQAGNRDKWSVMAGVRWMEWVSVNPVSLSCKGYGTLNLILMFESWSFTFQAIHYLRAYRKPCSTTNFKSFVERSSFSCIRCSQTRSESCSRRCRYIYNTWLNVSSMLFFIQYYW